MWRIVCPIQRIKDFCWQAQLQYISSCVRPDLCASVHLMASEVINSSSATYMKMGTVVDWCRETCKIGLTFDPFDRNTFGLALFTDASFANKEGLKSQLGYVIVLMDDNNKGNIVHYGSTACKRVTRYFMAAELHILAQGFGNAFLVRNILEETMGVT